MTYTSKKKNKNTTTNFKPSTSTKSITAPTATPETQVAYSAVNRADTLQRAGKYPVPSGSPQVFRMGAKTHFVGCFFQLILSILSTLEKQIA